MKRGSESFDQFAKLLIESTDEETSKLLDVKMSNRMSKSPFLESFSPRTAGLLSGAIPAMRKAKTLRNLFKTS